MPDQDEFVEHKGLLVPLRVKLAEEARPQGFTLREKLMMAAIPVAVILVLLFFRPLYVH